MFHFGNKFDIIGQSDKGIAIEVRTEDSLWNAVCDDEAFNYGDEFLLKLIVTPREITYVVGIPKLIRGENNLWCEHLTTNKPKVDHADALIMNKAMFEINKPLYDMLRNIQD
jgi:hypothetical protein